MLKFQPWLLFQVPGPSVVSLFIHFQQLHLTSFQSWIFGSWYFILSPHRPPLHPVPSLAAQLKCQLSSFLQERRLVASDAKQTLNPTASNLPCCRDSIFSISMTTASSRTPKSTFVLLPIVDTIARLLCPCCASLHLKFSWKNFCCTSNQMWTLHISKVPRRGGLHILKVPRWGCLHI